MRPRSARFTLFRSIPAISATLILAACGVVADPNAASEENFRTVLQPEVEKLACADLPISDPSVLAKRGPEVKPDDLYPLIGEIGYGFNFGTGQWVEGGVFPGDPGPEEAYRKLADLGALDRRELPIEYTDETMPFGMANSRRPHKYAIYTPKAGYEGMFSSTTVRYMSGKSAAVPALCFGEAKITSLQFTIPSDGEAKSSRVDYSWSAEPLGEAQQRIYSEDLVLVRKPKLSGQESVTLVLTNNGWQPIKAY